jgi:porphobilinogen deaminase
MLSPTEALADLRSILVEMRRCAVTKACRPDAKVETIAAAVAELQSRIESVDRALADETALAAAGAIKPKNGHRGMSLLERAHAALPRP